MRFSGAVADRDVASLLGAAGAAAPGASEARNSTVWGERGAAALGFCPSAYAIRHLATE
jgi:hypothetical protein